MNTCPQHQQRLIAMSLGMLDREERLGLERHLQSCPGCQAYLAEMRALSNQLSAQAELPTMEMPEGFHERWLAQIKRPNPPRRWLMGELIQRLDRGALRWAIPVAALIIIGIGSVLVFQKAPVTGPAPGPEMAVNLPQPSTIGDAVPAGTSLADYRRALAAEPDGLDELLRRLDTPSSGPKSFRLSSAYDTLGLNAAN